MRNEILRFNNVFIENTSCVGGKKESEGPLSAHFDMLELDEYFGKDTWEKAESEMNTRTVNFLLSKTKLDYSDIDLSCGGDLLNQCVATSFVLKNCDLPYLGLYGACSTMADSLIIGAVFKSANFAKRVLCFASSHFCSAEKQYRFPLEYGGQRTPTSQSTVTGCGAILLGDSEKCRVEVKEAVVGKIVDSGVTDVNNMGAAMAEAAVDTITRYFGASNLSPDDFDIIATGDLGREGYELACELFKRKKIELYGKYTDCGMLIYDLEKQDVHAGGSGCGCSAVVTAGYFYDKLIKGEAKEILLIGTGALLNPNTVFQKQSIPAVAHLVRLSAR